MTQLVAFLLAALLLVNSVSSQSHFDVSSKWWKKHFGSLSDPSSCPKPEKPEDGSLKIVGVSKVEYACNPTYTLVGRKDRLCACGEWVGSIPECRKDGEWSKWGDFSPCTKSCGGGRTTRQRQCDNPKPDHGAKYCDGSDTESRVCNTDSCPPECPIRGTLAFGPLTLTLLEDKRFLNVSCDDGYILADSTYSVLDCQLLNSTDVNALCVETCSSLTNPQNGTVTLGDGGLFAQFECDLGFVLQGSQTLLCENGEWIGDEPQCHLVEDTVEIPHFPAFAGLLGSNPSIVFRQDSYVRSQTFFAPICSTVLSFNYRMSPTVETVDIEAEMLESDIDSTIRNGSAIIARGNATLIGDGRVDLKFFCLEVQSCFNESLLPSSAVIRTLVRFVSPDSNNVLEISSMSVNEASNCSAGLNAEQSVRVKRDSDHDFDDDDDDDDDDFDDDDYNYDYDYSDDDEVDCDDSISSGDCGFTSNPCGVASFAVNLVGVDDNDDEGISIAPLQQKKSVESDACSVDVCIPCLADTGVSVSDANSSPQEGRNRRSIQYHSARKRFCAHFKEGRRFAIANSPKRLKKRFRRYLSFGYNLGGGAHNLVVKVVCFWGNNNRKSSVIKLGKNKQKHFKKIFTNIDPRRGTICLKLRKQKNCNKFQIEFTASGKSKVCVNSIKYLSKKHYLFSFFCGTIDNKQ